MRIHDPIADSEEPYNLVPLTDMVFNLLIFFMCATTFVQVEKEMSLQLPKVGPASLVNPTVLDQIIINIRQDGTVVVAGKPYDAGALQQYVSNAVRQRNDQSVIIRADERATVEHFADVARICKQAGVREAKLIYLENGK